MMRKIFTAQVKEEICKLFPEEQKDATREQEEQVI